MCGTFIVDFWILADILQDLHDVHDRLQDLSKMIQRYHILCLNHACQHLKFSMSILKTLFLTKPILGSAESSFGTKCFSLCPKESLSLVAAVKESYTQKNC